MPYIGTSPSQGVRRVHTYTATANQTSFSGAGAEGATLSYKDSNFVDVYQNGVKLGDADYTATSGTAIVLGTGATVSDLVVIVAYDVFSAADTVSKADGGQFDGNVTMAGTLGVTGTTALTGNATMAGTLGVTGVLTTTATAVFNGGFTSNGDTNTFTSSAQDDPVIILENTTNDSNSARLKFRKDRGAAGQDGDDIADILFNADNDAQEETTFASIRSEIIDASNGTEDGSFKITTKLAGTSVDRLQFNSTETIFNQDSVDLDFRVESNGNANMLFVDGGNNTVHIGQSVPDTTLSGGTPPFQITGSGFGATSAIVRREASSFGPSLMLAKSRNTAVGSHTIVQSGDRLGGIIFIGDDGTDLDTYGATITADCDGTPGANDMPGRLVFSTTADGANSPTERMRIHNGGVVSIPQGIALGVGTANTASNVLDDYEEGTWTPSFSGDIGFSNQGNFTYTKIGRTVHITGYMSGKSGTFGTTWSVNGLPFVGNANYNMAPLWSHGVDLMFMGYIVSGQNALNIRDRDNASQSGISEISVQMTYLTT